MNGRRMSGPVEREEVRFRVVSQSHLPLAVLEALKSSSSIVLSFRWRERAKDGIARQVWGGSYSGGAKYDPPIKVNNQGKGPGWRVPNHTASPTRLAGTRRIWRGFVLIASRQQGFAFGYLTANLINVLKKRVVG